MRILIDGYNLMHVAGLMKPRFGPGGLERARRALLNYLVGALKDQALHTTVMFDAFHPPPDAPREQRFKGLTVIFAETPGDADSVLERMIAADPTPKQLTVVSGDHRVMAAARHRRAITIDSDAYMETLRRRHRPNRALISDEPAEKTAGPSRKDAEYWVTVFGAMAGQIPQDDGVPSLSDAEIRALEIDPTIDAEVTRLVRGQRIRKIDRTIR